MSLLLLFKSGSAPPSGGFRSLTAIAVGGVSATWTIYGTLSKTNDDDTISASGTTTIVGTASKTENPDTLSASGSAGQGVEGTVNVTNTNDTLNAAGTPIVNGTVNRQAADDILSASGFTGDVWGFVSLALFEIGGIGHSNQVYGTLNVTAGSDTLEASGLVPLVVTTIHSRANRVGRGPYSLGEYFRKSRIAFTVDTPGRLAVVNANDTLSAAGWANIITGILSLTTTSDSIVASGSSSNNGTVSVTNANDTLDASGTTIISGTVSVTNNDDIGIASGFAGDSPDVSSYRPLTGAGT